MSSHNAFDQSVSFPPDEKIHLKPIGPVVPGQLTLPHDAIWEVYTACVINTTEVWIRFGNDNVNRLCFFSSAFSFAKLFTTVVLGEFC